MNSFAMLPMKGTNRNNGAIVSAIWDGDALEGISDLHVLAITELGAITQQTPTPLHDGRVYYAGLSGRERAKVGD